MPECYQPIWLSTASLGGQSPDTPNLHGAFRGTFHLSKAAKVRLEVLACWWYRIWLDGGFLSEGPPRFHPRHPEYEVFELYLSAGLHVLAAHVHHAGVAMQTILADQIPPFLLARVIQADGTEVHPEWKCLHLEAWEINDLRRSGLHGWVESIDQSRMIRGWESPGFDDRGWHVPDDVTPFWESIRPAEISPVANHVMQPKIIDHGMIDGSFRYYRDDLPIGLYARRLDATAPIVTGRWWRMDLGRVRLGRLELRMNVPEGCHVEVGVSEALMHGRVMPWVYLSNSTSIWIDKFESRGGEDVFAPHVPRGGRYIEVHAEGPPDKLELIDCWFHERVYFPPIEETPNFGDRDLERIWHAGVETLRACSEDALVDTPVRERGQWTGDTLSVGLELITSLYTDSRLIARAQRQIAQCAREDGLVPSLSPGANRVFFLSYACIWQESLWTHFERTGNDAPIRENLEASLANMKFFEQRFSGNGLNTHGELTFIDWGYLPRDGDPDLATCLFLRRALRNSTRMYSHVRCESGAADAADFLARVDVYLSQELGRRNLETLGYHVVALAWGEGLLTEDQGAGAADYIKRHILSCFPNDPSAPRLYSVLVNNRRIFTPYFSHFVLPLLIDAGEMDFVLPIIRKCWGWSLGEGRTTLMEVFDEHWTHSHHWSACPTWLLSQYCLGLRPAFGRGVNHWDFVLNPGNLKEGSGTLPGGITVRWKRQPESTIYTVRTSHPMVIHDTTGRIPKTPFEVQTHAEFQFEATNTGDDLHHDGTFGNVVRR